jgi:dipeptide/tripeptide permease
LFGAVLLTIGHCFMAFEGNGSGHQNDPALNIFWLALAFIIVGSGFLKPTSRSSWASCIRAPTCAGWRLHDLLHGH